MQVQTSDLFENRVLSPDSRTGIVNSYRRRLLTKTWTITNDVYLWLSVSVRERTLNHLEIRPAAPKGVNNSAAWQPTWQTDIYKRVLKSKYRRSWNRVVERVDSASRTDHIFLCNFPKSRFFVIIIFDMWNEFNT